MKLVTSIAMGVVFAAGPWCPVAKAQDTHVGWIDKMDCNGKWRAADRDASQPLRVKTDLYRFLYPGESVRCDGTGRMTLRILDNDPKTISRLDGWCKILNEEVLCEKEKSAKPDAKAKPTADEEALTTFGRPGGRRRGFGSSIFSPAAESTVRADKLVVRWNEIPGASRITLRLTDKYHGLLWEQADVDAGARQLVSPEARLALAAYRDKGGASPYSLVLSNGGVAQPDVQFSILRADEERALDSDLAKCAKKSGLSHFVCRTYAFTHRGMWNDAAEEYESALKLEPASQALSLAALTGELNVGNAARVSELKAMLPAGAKTPE
jgi:hypothetical protein